MYVIAGPCSAESEEQVLQTAASLREIGIDAFRAGIWKPRTRPGCFEGHGAKALPWLNMVQKQFGMKVCCEVGGSNHVEECLKAGIDMIWLGARTTANPFLVQEISDSLRGVDIPVLVKNPVNADLGLWIGAFERLERSGVKDLSAVHRGVSSFSEQKYRNNPAWDMAVRLRNQMRDIPLYCDPSHMGGLVKYVRELAQRALNLGFEGLMIEVHCCPESALSDKDQQLTPSALRELLNGKEKLNVRKTDSDDGAYRRNINLLREKIDVIDAEILSLMADRMDISRQIGAIKHDDNIAIFQPSRWGEIISEMTEQGSVRGLSEDFVRTLFDTIHKESILVQEKSAKENAD